MNKQRFTGRVPFGYTFDGVSVRINPDEAKTLKLIYDGLLAGSSYKEIITSLNNDNIKTQNGKLWMFGTITALLSEKRVWFYAGYRNGIPGDWEAILTKEYAVELIKVLGKRRTPQVNKTRRVRTSFSGVGILYCGICGATMKLSYSTSDRLYYVCRSKTDAGSCQDSIMMRADIIDDLILSKVAAVNFAEAIKFRNESLQSKYHKEIFSLCAELPQLHNPVKRTQKANRLAEIIKESEPLQVPPVPFAKSTIKQYIKKISLTDKLIEVECNYPVSTTKITTTLKIRYDYAKFKIKRTVS